MGLYTAELFEDSKAKLIELISEGIRTYDTSLPTCILYDWIKEGIGYLLLKNIVLVVCRTRQFSAIMAISLFMQVLDLRKNQNRVTHL